MPHRFPAALFATLAVLAGAPSASAFDLHGASVETASGNDTKMLRLALQRDIRPTWFRSGGRHLGAYWDLSLAGWRGESYRDHPGVRQTLTDVGLTPVFRYRRDDRLGWYGELGIGIHHLSGHYDNGGEQLSTRFQFGDHLGAGYVFDNGLDLGLKFQHFSNGGVKEPNGGVNFVVIKAGFRF